MEKQTSEKENKATGPFAVIETGGKQYIVASGDVLEVELLQDAPEGEKVVFDKVLLKDDGKSTEVGAPYITGAKVQAVSMGDKKGKKLSIIRYKAKSNRSRKVGHRQKYTQVKIESI